MGKILDDFMEKHELDDAHVLAMIGDAYLQIVSPEFVYNYDKNKVVPDDVKKEAKAMVDDSAFAILEALMDRFSGGLE